MFTLDIQRRIATIGLSRPETRNAVPLRSWAKLAECVGEAAASGARALLVRSLVPGIFCGGADIAEFAGFADPARQADLRLAMAEGLGALRDIAIPSFAVIDGGCFGAGVALALACDMRIAGKGARFGVPPSRLGITYPQADIARLTALVGPGQAARLFLIGDQIDADEALRIGLVEMMETAPDERAEALALRISLSNAPTSLRLLKRSIALAEAGVARDAGMDAAFDAAFGSQDLAEGLAAFREKRSPVFEG
ncbi:enoyl-CoA hydratase/isomerase family protein [Flavisphingomonas formosensis]|uniref:enoyl-CoA hydratase/isomerase family protein n=1 Tax=Flavisphingomonas formosensis TaxID=861534 RepID=UPI0012F9CDD8|nr:enoyl-CoA hydratase-related protein [Sphingomonas formosensis]